MRTLRGCLRSRWSVGVFRSLLVLSAVPLFAEGQALPAQNLPRLVPTSPPDSFALAAADAPYRFLGRVVNRGQVATGPLRAAANTMVVQVDSVIAQPAMVRPIKNQTLTLVVRDTAGIVKNGSYVVLANAIALGTGLTLRELARMSLSKPESLAVIRTRLREADSLNRRLEIKLRAQNRVVVVGRVDTVILQPPSTSVEREHDSDWRIARVKVLQTLPPSSPSLQQLAIEVLFRGSEDAIFAHSARLHAPDTLVLFMRPVDSLPAGPGGGRGGGRSGGRGIGRGAGGSRFVVIDELEARPLSELPLIVDVLR